MKWVPVGILHPAGIRQEVSGVKLPRWKRALPPWPSLAYAGDGLLVGTCAPLVAGPSSAMGVEE